MPVSGLKYKASLGRKIAVAANSAKWWRRFNNLCLLAAKGAEWL